MLDCSFDEGLVTLLLPGSRRGAARARRLAAPGERALAVWTAGLLALALATLALP